MSNIIFIFTGFIVLIFMTFALCHDYFNYVLAKYRWAKCTGIISKVDVQQVMHSSDKGVEVNQTQKIYVTYISNNVTYKNVRLDLDMPTLKEGDEIVLHINPNNPTEFQIDRDIKDILFPLSIIIFLFILLVLVVIYQ